MKYLEREVQINKILRSSIYAEGFAMLFFAPDVCLNLFSFYSEKGNLI